MCTCVPDASVLRGAAAQVVDVGLAIGRAARALALPQHLAQAVHGGVLMSLMDSAMSSAALSASGFTKAVVTIDMTSSFLKPAHGRLVAHASVQGGGKSVCFCECRIEDEAGHTVARAMGTFRYVRP